MKIIKTQNYEREGNDCMIYNTLTLYEHNGEYFFQVDEGVAGWCENKSSRHWNVGKTNIHSHESIQKSINDILLIKYCRDFKFDIIEEMNI